jgi:transglutaminase-like putative cysteine protease
MKISVTHTTTYHYEFPVLLEAHLIRLRPRMSSEQILLNYYLHISPTPAGTTECLDQDGNLATSAWFTQPTSSLQVVNSFTVQLLRHNAFDYVIGKHPLDLALWYPEPLASSLAPYRMDAGVHESVRNYAQGLAASSQWNALTFLMSLTLDLNRTCNQLIRPVGSPWAAETTLSQRQGSCRDLAVLFCSACRTMGIAARFVSGYELASASSAQPYMHAWAEVYLPGIGWRGYDPSRGLAVTNAHIPVAAGFDSELAAPVAGWYSGNSQSNMTATIIMNADMLS